MVSGIFPNFIILFKSVEIGGVSLCAKELLYGSCSRVKGEQTYLIGSKSSKYNLVFHLGNEYAMSVGKGNTVYLLDSFALKVN